MPEIFDSGDLEDKKTKRSAQVSKKDKKEQRNWHRHVDEYSNVMRNEKATEDRFSWYIPKPKRMTFSEQEKDEHLILVLRQHPVTQLKWFLLAVILALMPFLFISTGVFDFLPDRFYFAGFIGWYLVITGYVIEALLKWFYNVYIITDERIVDVDFHSLLSRNISSAKIDKIEDVTAITTGLLATVFDYGNVEIQTAAEQREFEFEGIPNPNKVATLINELILEEELEKVEGRVR